MFLSYVRGLMKPLFWMDLEMTGLDETRDVILEVAVVVTDLQMQTLHEYQQVVKQPTEVLETMNDWCKKTHGESGLTALVPNGVPLEQVERELLEITGRFYKSNERIVLAGNSIWNDRKFIDRYLPEFAKRLHYRMVDVSSFKEIFRERYSVRFEKANGHRALDDAHESIHELSYYLTHIQVPAPPSPPEAP